jgi:hypothetical protein
LARAPLKRAYSIFCPREKIRELEIPYFIDVFANADEMSHALLIERAAPRAARGNRDRRDARCGADPCANTLDYAKTLVFLSRCSNR